MYMYIYIYIYVYIYIYIYIYTGEPLESENDERKILDLLDLLP